MNKLPERLSSSYALMHGLVARGVEPPAASAGIAAVLGAGPADPIDDDGPPPLRLAIVSPWPWRKTLLFDSAECDLIARLTTYTPDRQGWHTPPAVTQTLYMTPRRRLVLVETTRRAAKARLLWRFQALEFLWGTGVPLATYEVFFPGAMRAA